ncbi:uncharacterized protein LAESUDRAFT_681253 [Laetiporus sulphureus 93-53]|uniref:non-specific serine/threonine protein kinase n=1 Tax=Laetiporus sulphureus 93-53 TaxID=1314785 RepID=A0A165DUM9_9APHY|nr:uncharacterized protein LAESUDRAFT_681253 [Laetiporus sulphureus 93-53]KZT05662.1 hypothetical protein LAESUDRAFT_681253 [Laetiporus sulphureus 93-53]
MLGARTKQVYAYGRRGSRIVNVSDDRDNAVKDNVETRRQDDDSSSDFGSSPLETNKRTLNSHRGTSPIPLRLGLAPIEKKKPKKPGRPRESAVSKPRKPFDPYQERKAEPAGSKLDRIANIQNPVGPSTRKARKSSIAVSKLVKQKSPVLARRPLHPLPPSALNSPVVSTALKKTRNPVGKGLPYAPRSPVVDVDIFVLDPSGRRVSRERRVSRSGVQANCLAGPSNWRDTKLLIDLAEDSDEGVPPAKRRKAPILTIISSDESDEESDMGKKLPGLKLSVNDEDDDPPIRPPRARAAKARRRINIIASPETSPSPPQVLPPKAKAATSSKARGLPEPAPEFVLWTPRPAHAEPAAPAFPTLISQHTKVRQLTPIRRRPGHIPTFLAPPSPPSPTTPTDLDLSLDFDELSLLDADLKRAESIGLYAAPPPAFIRPLLDECAQRTPHEFSAFIETFPFDPIVYAEGTASASAQFQKIGEASYSEVFGIGDVVLKVIPLRDEEKQAHGRAFVDESLDIPAPSDAKDVLKEIIVTRAIGDICDGYVKLLRTYIVRGKYPSLLLDLWDEYNEKKGSEAVRPDGFSVSQLYAIIVLPNGGPDLEAYTFKTASKTGWTQACSLFWQVARALADAEELVCFEHRDLHWGQILVKDIPVTSKPTRKTTKKMPMDDECHGVEVTLIDLGLARMNSSDKGVHWTPFDEEIFEGQGDYQFDVYRMMREHNGNSWREFRPFTNVMWLHYLALKLLHSKRLRAPPAPRKNAAPKAVTKPAHTERECYECLVEMQAVLADCLESCKPPRAAKRGRRKTQVPVKVIASTMLESAGDVVQLAVERGWIEGDCEQ